VSTIDTLVEMLAGAHECDTAILDSVYQIFMDGSKKILEKFRLIVGRRISRFAFGRIKKKIKMKQILCMFTF